MRENLSGLIKIVGISLLLVVLWLIMSIWVSEKFLSPNNIENLLRRTALYGILGVGVALVIMTSGIDLSLGSLVCLCGCLLALFLQVDYRPAQQYDVWEANSAAQTIVVAANQDLKPGAFVRLYNARKLRNLVARVEEVSPVEVSGKQGLLLKLDQKPSRDDALDRDATSIGKIAVLSPLVDFQELTNSSGGQAATDAGSTGSSQVVVATHLSSSPRDRLLFVSPKGALAERTIKSITSEPNQTSILVEGDLAGVDKTWMVIPVSRKQRMSVPVAVGAVMLIAGGVGLFHGLLITWLGLQPFVVTLCGLLAYRGLARRLSDDQVVGFGNEYSETLNALSTGRWVLWESVDQATSFGIPYVFFILILVVVLASVFLNLTIWGRYILALGKNQEAARYSGISTGAMICLTYVLCGLATGLGGILHSLDANSISPSSFGNWFELWAIAAAVLGGCSLRGGEGGIIGVIVGTALMQTLYNMIVLLKIPSEMEPVIIGIVILMAVIVDELIRKVANLATSKRAE